MYRQKKNIQYIHFFFYWHESDIFLVNYPFTHLPTQSPNITPKYVDYQLLNSYWKTTLPLVGQNQYFRRCFIFLNPFPMIWCFAIIWMQLSYSSTDSFLDLNRARVRVLSTASILWQPTAVFFPRVTVKLLIAGMFSSLQRELLGHLPEAVW